MRRISIFGATGSIGEQCVGLIRRSGPEVYHTVAVTGGQNIARLARIAKDLRAEIAVTADPARLTALRDALQGSGIEARAGPEAIAAAADRPADWVMSAIIGAAGLEPGLRALQHGGILALANKESLVSAGELLLQTAARYGATVLPVDSEHSAIFQALGDHPAESVDRVILTASGGALRDWPVERLASATVQEALNHPNWSMGARITIDSASMFNKAMEIIEVREFFGMRPDQIEVVIHRESIMHSAVAFSDGAVMAHMGVPDMRHPIGYALNWPQRRALPVQPLDLTALGRLTFTAPDEARYPALRLAREVMATRGCAGAAFTAAKEVALDHFMGGRIGFMDMAGIIEDALARLASEARLQDPASSLEDVLEMDHLARMRAGESAMNRAARRRAG